MFPPGVDVKIISATSKEDEKDMERHIVVSYRKIDNAGDLHKAEAKFQELDANGDGELNEAEMKHLVEWIYMTFQPPGYAPGAMDKKMLGREARKLIKTLDADGSKGISFEEFIGYYDKKVKQAEAL